LLLEANGLGLPANPGRAIRDAGAGAGLSKIPLFGEAGDACNVRRVAVSARLRALAGERRGATIRFESSLPSHRCLSGASLMRSKVYLREMAAWMRRWNGTVGW
jgi:hypothetical protein